MLDPSILWESLPKHTPRWKATSALGSILSTEPLFLWSWLHSTLWFGWTRSAALTWQRPWWATLRMGPFWWPSPVSWQTRPGLLVRSSGSSDSQLLEPAYFLEPGYPPSESLWLRPPKRSELLRAPGNWNLHRIVLTTAISKLNGLSPSLLSRNWPQKLASKLALKKALKNSELALKTLPPNAKSRDPIVSRNGSNETL